jgi:VanZ family protein
MPTERFACLAAASGIMLGLLVLRSHAIPPGWDEAAHFCTFALITGLVWRGTAGAAPLAVLGGVVAFATLDELRQLFVPGRGAELTHFIADALAAATVCSALFIRRKLLCAELSRPLPAATSSRS